MSETWVLLHQRLLVLLLTKVCFPFIHSFIL